MKPPPSPTELRLSCSHAYAKPPGPPFGLKAYTPDAADVAVLLGPDGDLQDASAIAVQLANPSTLPAGTLVVLFGHSAPSRGIFGRWFGAGAVPIGRSPRCTALLARGYIDIGVYVDPRTRTDLVYATVPRTAAMPGD